MRPAPAPALILLADSPAVFTELGGISLLERCRRLALRLGFREATVMTHDPGAVEAHFASERWRRRNISLAIRRSGNSEISAADIIGVFAPDSLPSRILLVSAAFYFDERLLKALSQRTVTTALMDSTPAWPEVAGEIGAALLQDEWLRHQDQNTGVMQLLTEQIVVADVADPGPRPTTAATLQASQVAILDAAAEPSYVQSMRRQLRPVFFPAPAKENHARSERFLRDATQKGSLDFPAVVHAPIEKWIVSSLGRTPITPNQITLVTGFLGVGVTILYACGHLWAGTLLALAIGILDGLDGKIARLKVQMTPAGKYEHALDFVIERSWWTALAWHFYATGIVPNAFLLLVMFLLVDLADRIARWSIEPRLGRTLDDFSPFDRLVRFVGARRNVFIWVFALFLALGAAAAGFKWLCWWGIGTAAIHLFRTAQVRLGMSLPGAWNSAE